MDSISQAALGSAVVLATLGRRTAAWKAARGEPPLAPCPTWTLSSTMATRCSTWCATGPRATPWHYSRWHRPRWAGWPPACRVSPTCARRWWLAMALALITHPLLDTLTVYGTQLLQPFSNHPFAVGSVFIIDPFYTLPLLLGVLVAVSGDPPAGCAGTQPCWRSAPPTWGGSVLAQQHVRGVLEASLRHNGMAASQMLVTPAPFSTVLWRAVAMGPEHYHEAYYSLLDGAHPVAWTSHPRGADLRLQHADNPHVQRLSWFSHGFMRMQANSQGGSPSPTCAWGWSPAIRSTSTSAQPTPRRARRAQWFSNGSALIFRWPCPGCGAA